MRCPSVCPCVCLCVCHVRELRQNEWDIFEIFSPSGSQAILVFLCQTGWRYSDGNPPPLTGASNVGGVGKKRDSERISLHTLHTGGVLYNVVNRTSREVWKIKPRRTASSRSFTAASVAVVRTRRRRSVCAGLNVIRRRRRSNPPGHNPLVIILFSAAVGHRRTEPGGYFC